jgi:hypothetical protein
MPATNGDGGGKRFGIPSDPTARLAALIVIGSVVGLAVRRASSTDSSGDSGTREPPPAGMGRGGHGREANRPHPPRGAVGGQREDSRPMTRIPAQLDTTDGDCRHDVRR